MINAKKSLSQNFLIDKNISEKIVKQTNLKNKNVLEIGPGYGFLTDSILIEEPKRIILVEKDTDLKKKLYQKYKNNKKIEIIGDDVLNFNFSKFKDLIVVSNLPYNISSKITLYLFNFNENINEMIFMMQKEVAQKFNYNLPNMNKYKFLTRIVSDFTICFDVSPQVFIPKPKVYSTVVKFKFFEKKNNLKKATNFSKIIFKNVRKKIHNNIKIRINSALENKRVNQLTIDELLTIYDFF